MRSTLTLFTVLALAGGVGACSDDAPERSTGTSSPSTPAPVTTIAATPPVSATVLVTAAGTTDEQLAGMLLTVADIGDGWTAETKLDPADLGGPGESPCPDVAINPTIAQRLRATTGVQFEPVDGSLRGIQELLVRSEDPGRLALDMDAVFGAIEQCIGIETTAPDGELVTLEPLELPPIGDERLGVAVTVLEPPEFQTTTWLGHIAIVRVGNVAIMINQFDIVDSPDVAPPTSDADFVTILERAVERVDR